jgi:hypothetical protein
MDGGVWGFGVANLGVFEVGGVLGGLGGWGFGTVVQLRFRCIEYSTGIRGTLKP